MLFVPDCDCKERSKKMEFKKGKWIRQSKAAAILLLVVAMLLAIYGSFAAYTKL